MGDLTWLWLKSLSRFDNLSSKTLPFVPTLSSNSLFVGRILFSSSSVLAVLIFLSSSRIVFETAPRWLLSLTSEVDSDNDESGLPGGWELLVNGDSPAVSCVTVAELILDIQAQTARVQSTSRSRSMTLKGSQHFWSWRNRDWKLQCNTR